MSQPTNAGQSGRGNQNDLASMLAQILAQNTAMSAAMSASVGQLSASIDRLIEERNGFKHRILALEGATTENKAHPEAPLADIDAAGDQSASASADSESSEVQDQASVIQENTASEAAGDDHSRGSEEEGGDSEDMTEEESEGESTLRFGADRAKFDLNDPSTRARKVPHPDGEDKWAPSKERHGTMFDSDSRRFDDGPETFGMIPSAALPEWPTASLPDNPDGNDSGTFAATQQTWGDVQGGNLSDHAENSPQEELNDDAQVKKCPEIAIPKPSALSAKKFTSANSSTNDEKASQVIDDMSHGDVAADQSQNAGFYIIKNELKARDPLPFEEVDPESAERLCALLVLVMSLHADAAHQDYVYLLSKHKNYASLRLHEPSTSKKSESKSRHYTEEFDKLLAKCYDNNKAFQNLFGISCIKFQMSCEDSSVKAYLRPLARLIRQSIGPSPYDKFHWSDISFGNLYEEHLDVNFVLDTIAYFASAIYQNAFSAFVFDVQSTGDPNEPIPTMDVIKAMHILMRSRSIQDFRQFRESLDKIDDANKDYIIGYLSATLDDFNLDNGFSTTGLMPPPNPLHNPKDHGEDADHFTPEEYRELRRQREVRRQNDPPVV